MHLHDVFIFFLCLLHLVLFLSERYHQAHITDSDLQHAGKQAHLQHWHRYFQTRLAVCALQSGVTGLSYNGRSHQVWLCASDHMIMPLARIRTSLLQSC